MKNLKIAAKWEVLKTERFLLGWALGDHLPRTESTDRN